jgi:gamma-glutamylcyclotransferase (GGCT)/AIG2-like uncharacterized protein YtfP
MSTNRIYFAYGLNLSPDILAGKVAQARCLGPAKLNGWRLAYYGHSSVWGGGCESLVEEPGRAAWGLLYELDPRQAELLDSFEDARLDGTGAYFHCPIQVEKDGGRLAAVTYLKAICGPEASPSTEALAKLCEGAGLAGLPAEYCQELRDLSSVPAGFKVPRALVSFHRGLSSGEHCGSCGMD